MSSGKRMSIGSSPPGDPMFCSVDDQLDAGGITEPDEDLVLRFEHEAVTLQRSCRPRG